MVRVYGITYTLLRNVNGDVLTGFVLALVGCAPWQAAKDAKESREVEKKVKKKKKKKDKDKIKKSKKRHSSISPEDKVGLDFGEVPFVLSCSESFRHICMLALL